MIMLAGTAVRARELRIKFSLSSFLPHSCSFISASLHPSVQFSPVVLSAYLHSFISQSLSSLCSWLFAAATSPFSPLLSLCHASLFLLLPLSLRREITAPQPVGALTVSINLCLFLQMCAMRKMTLADPSEASKHSRLAAASHFHPPVSPALCN